MFVKNKSSKQPYPDIAYLDEKTKNQIIETQRIEEKGIIILCEFEEFLQDKYSKILKDIDLECKCVRTGYDLFEELSNSKCEILVMDVMLAGSIDGLQVIRTLRESLKLRFPIIVLTNMTSTKITEVAYAVGADDYLIKTDIEEEDLVRAVKKKL